LSASKKKARKAKKAQKDEESSTYTDCFRVTPIGHLNLSSDCMPNALTKAKVCNEAWLKIYAMMENEVLPLYINAIKLQYTFEKIVTDRVQNEILDPGAVLQLINLISHEANGVTVAASNVLALANANFKSYGILAQLVTETYHPFRSSSLSCIREGSVSMPVGLQFSRI